MTAKLTVVPKRAAPKAILYARVSTGRQAKRDLSVPDQFRQLRAHCKEQGIEIVGEFRDAKSGRTMDRPGLNAAREHISNAPGQVDYLLIHSFSRITRNALDYGLIQLDFDKRGVEIVSISQQVGTSPEGELFRKIINAFDEHQSHETAKHVSRSMKENARQGFWNGGIAPFGFRACDAGTRAGKPKKKLEIDVVEAEDIRLVYSLYLNGDGKAGPMGVGKVTKWLNANGHLRRGSHWTVGLTYRVLTDRTYIGEREYKRDCDNDEQIITSVPAIMDELSFQRAQHVLRKKNPLNSKPRELNSPVLLTGTARCGSCGGGMILQTGKGGKYRYYKCSNSIKKRLPLCDGQSVNMETLDDAVMGHLAEALLNVHRTSQVLTALANRLDERDRELASRVGGLESELQERESSVARLYEGVAKGTFDLNDSLFLSMLNKAQEEREIVQAKMSKLLEQKDRGFGPTAAQYDEFSAFLKNQFKTGSVGFRKAYLKAFVERIDVNGSQIRIIPKDLT
jgi:site-specific DNA recombinase